ncbi:myosin-13-like [Argopecten irradians]|uniref:myosin-13-like n=1 Tax=Argopecten irradians TaxID=31199 RepID=UPI00371144C4
MPRVTWEDMPNPPAHVPEKKVRRREHPPPTREAEYKAIITKVNDVCLQIRKFARKYLDRKAVEYAECDKCLSELLRSWEMDASDFKTWKELSDKLKFREIRPEMRESESYKNLLYICDRAKSFETNIPGIREKLVKCTREHLQKYCKSFIEEMGSLDIRPVFDYEEALKGYKSDIDVKIDQINTNILTYGELKTPFDKFISEGSVHGSLMEEVCVAVVEVSHTVKQWVAEDATYPDRLLQEIFFNNSYKENLEEDILRLNAKHRDAERSLERKHKTFAYLHRQHLTYKKEKKKLKASLETVTNKIEKLDQQQRQKQEEITQLNTSLGDKTPRSHRDKEELGLRLDRTEENLDRVREWKSVSERQQVRLERELKQVSDRTYELKVEAVTVRHEEDDMKNSLLGIEIEVKSIKDRITSIEEKNAVLKRIRVLKLSSDTLRILHKRRVQPRGRETSESSVQASVAASDIGHGSADGKYRPSQCVHVCLWCVPCDCSTCLTLCLLHPPVDDPRIWSMFGLRV